MSDVEKESFIDDLIKRRRLTSWTLRARYRAHPIELTLVVAMLCLSLRLPPLIAIAFIITALLIDLKGPRPIDRLKDLRATLHTLISGRISQPEASLSSKLEVSFFVACAASPRQA
ncbi:MAG: hypothetical protein AAGH60_13925 [Pseudomonadota bacterium]